jgi:hypothetical protein
MSDWLIVGIRMMAFGFLVAVRDSKSRHGNGHGMTPLWTDDVTPRHFTGLFLVSTIYLLHTYGITASESGLSI